MVHLNYVELKLDLSRPDWLFAFIWAIPLILVWRFPLPFFEPLHTLTLLLIGGNILTFFIVYNFMRYLLGSKAKKTRKVIDENEIRSFEKFLNLSLPIWIFLYLIPVIVNGGAPLIWILTEDTRTYTDFGIPSYSGFIYMLRAFLLMISFQVYIYTRRIKFLLVCFLFLFTAFIVEASRGNGIVLLLHPIGLYLFLNKIPIKKIFKIVIYAVFFGVLFGILENFRYLNSENYNIKSRFEDIVGVEPGNVLLIYLLPFYLYITTPLQNVNLLASINLQIDFIPYYSTQGLFPTFIRSFIFKPKDYGVLLNEGFNTTSFYTPFIRDFGFLGAFIIVVFIQFVVSFVHIKGRIENGFFYKLFYPVLFMSVVLSPFSLFFTSLVTVLFPFVVLVYLHVKSKYKLNNLKIL